MNKPTASALVASPAFVEGGLAGLQQNPDPTSQELAFLVNTGCASERAEQLIRDMLPDDLARLVAEVKVAQGIVPRGRFQLRQWLTTRFPEQAVITSEYRSFLR